MSSFERTSNLILTKWKEHSEKRSFQYELALYKLGLGKPVWKLLDNYDHLTDFLLIPIQPYV